MGSYEATDVVLSKIKNLDPENASKIMGFLLMNLEESELVRLACSPDPVLHTLVLRVKTHLGSTLSSPSSPSPLNPISRLTRTSSNPFSKSSPRMPTNAFDFTKNPSSPSSHVWPHSGFPNNPNAPKLSPLLSYENIRAASSFSSPRVNGDCNTVHDFVDEEQVNEYFPFLNESSKNEDLVDPRLELGFRAHNWNSVNNGDAHFHRRSYSASDACFGGCEEPVIGYKPCLYFAKGFCKNGTNCKFVHGGLSDSLDAAVTVGSPSKFEGLEQREEFIRFKAAQHQRLMAASQLVAGASPSSYDRYIDFLMQQQNDHQRAALMMGEEFYNFGRGRLERNDFLAMVSGEKSNSASRQIYLTFPAESTFKDEDVSEYFSKFGPVQDVRIPYQQKRMFGFVTFVYPETVRLILSKGNPHFICDSRVLVKPYKEKGKIPDKRQQHQQQQLERGDFSPCLSPSGFDSKEPCDFHLGARMLYNPHDVLLRKKFEEQAELQQSIELQARRLNNLQLPDFKNNPIHQNQHQRSLSVGAPFPLPYQLYSHTNNAGHSSDSIKGDITGYGDSLTSTKSLGTASEQQQPRKEVDPACVDDTDSGNIKDGANAEVIDHSNSVEQALPDSLFASPTKAAGDYVPNFSTLAEVNESSSSHKKLELTTTSGDVASR
ncbi:zinc finger CCCH domain-containing protein 55-like isoform X2 [Gastrolobium bilobum]|uniref:zinc finger CCCH domain-containing protein 55-like isoform X2 n=1 Tax=Gastrolobium bilobum TaxID=150636 RepID=UPI002AB1D757|nr:zinc finger CCCH domain-containing protein 55-like isoform X2 [Gastrolobium bilobum]